MGTKSKPFFFCDQPLFDLEYEMLTFIPRGKQKHPIQDKVVGLL